MRSERPMRRKVLCGVAALAVALVLVPTLVGQEGPAAQPPAPSATDAFAEPIAPGGPSLSPAASTPGGPLLGAVHLRADGNLAGRIGVFNSSGAHSGAVATVSFVRNGEVVATAISDEAGNFQVPGLSPGVYSVAVSSQSGFAAMIVQVLPYDASAAEEALLWDVTLVPTAEAELFGLTGGNAAAGAPFGGAMLPSSAGFGGFGGGGGSGIGGLLGVGGLAAGIAALATENQQSTASPSTP